MFSVSECSDGHVVQVETGKTFILKSGTPPPRQRKPGAGNKNLRGKTRWPLSSMKVGEYFDTPTEDKIADRLRANLNALARHHGIKLRIEDIYTDSTPSLRVWRVL